MAADIRTAVIFRTRVSLHRKIVKHAAASRKSFSTDIEHLEFEL
ncbi:hypothetical protein [Streptomyces lucensis]|nr:hypothetical protein [Streptomyces lucensis]